MTAPIYLKPTYINYDMIARQLRVGQVNVVFIEEADSGLYIGQVETLMANAESYIIQTILSNYVECPLQTMSGFPFESLLDNPAYANTYIQIRNTFIAQSLIYIFQNYFSFGGEGNNGEQLIKQQQQIVNNFTTMAMRINQGGDLQYKNIFNGLKPCQNASQRMPSGVRTPTGIIDGRGRADLALNAVPNLRWTNRG